MDINIDIMAILSHYIQLVVKAVQDARRISKVKRNEIISDRIRQNWFKRFMCSNLSNGI